MEIITTPSIIEIITTPSIIIQSVLLVLIFGVFVKNHKALNSAKDLYQDSMHLGKQIECVTAFFLYCQEHRDSLPDHVRERFEECLAIQKETFK